MWRGGGHALAKSLGRSMGERGPREAERKERKERPCHDRTDLPTNRWSPIVISWHCFDWSIRI